MTDLQEKRELAQEAKEILESKAFEAAKSRIAATGWSAPWSPAAPTHERQLQIVAKIQVIDEIEGQLRALINDYNAGVRAQGRSQNARG